MSDTPDSAKTVIKTQICLFSYGGIEPMTHACLMRDTLEAVQDGDTTYELVLTQAFNDALIDRCRATVAEQFLSANQDVLVMLDHDLSWQPGDVVRIAKKAHELQAIVGGAVSKRTRGQGIASALTEVGAWKSGTDRVVGASYVGAAFTAYPRVIVQAIMSTRKKSVQGFRPGFIPCTWPHASSRSNIAAQITLPVTASHLIRQLGQCKPDAVCEVHDSAVFACSGDVAVDYLSEDWAACRRAMELGFSCYLDLKPQILHHGAYAYSIGDAFAGMSPDQNQVPPMFSLLHATRGRPDQALKTRELWMSRASGMHPLEYIFSVDNDDPRPLPIDAELELTKLISGDNKGCVDAYNRAAYASSGDVLIQVHDDLEPPLNWDTLLAAKLPDKAYEQPHVLRVSDGLPKMVNGEKSGRLLTILIGTSSWFKQCGWFWNPDFISVGCDDHMTELAEQEGVIIDASDITFPHHWEGADRDETQRRSYRGEAWKRMQFAMKKHRKRGFPKQPEAWGAM